MIPVQPYLPWKISISILHLIAALSSALRVEYRCRTGRLWWDDYASIVPAVFECFTIAIIWLRLRRYDDSERSQHFKVAFSYMNSTFFCLIIWWSRISLALAVVRITPVWSKTQPWVIGFTCIFILNWIALMLGMMITCSLNTAWKHVKADILICGPSYGVTLATVATDVIGDLLLVGFPLYRLWYIKLQPAQRCLVLLVFSTSVLTLAAATAVAIVSYGRYFKGAGALLVWLMTANIEESISVIACNLPVLVSWGYRVYSRDDEDAPGDHITPHWSRVAPGRLSTPMFVLTDLSGSRRQISENIVQISVSEASLPSQIRARGEERFNEGRKVTEDFHDTTSRKDTIV